MPETQLLAKYSAVFEPPEKMVDQAYNLYRVAFSSLLYRQFNIFKQSYGGLSGTLNQYHSTIEGSKSDCINIFLKLYETVFKQLKTLKQDQSANTTGYLNQIAGSLTKTKEWDYLITKFPVLAEPIEINLKRLSKNDYFIAIQFTSKSEPPLSTSIINIGEFNLPQTIHAFGYDLLGKSELIRAILHHTRYSLSIFSQLFEKLARIEEQIKEVKPWAFKDIVPSKDLFVGAIEYNGTGWKYEYLVTATSDRAKKHLTLILNSHPAQAQELDAQGQFSMDNEKPTLYLIIEIPYIEPLLQQLQYKLLTTTGAMSHIIELLEKILNEFDKVNRLWKHIRSIIMHELTHYSQWVLGYATFGLPPQTKKKKEYDIFGREIRSKTPDIVSQPHQFRDIEAYPRLQNTIILFQEWAEKHKGKATKEELIKSFIKRDPNFNDMLGWPQDYSNKRFRDMLRAFLGWIDQHPELFE